MLIKELILLEKFSYLKTDFERNLKFIHDICSAISAYLPFFPTHLISSAHPSPLCPHHLCHCQSRSHAYKAAEL